MGIQARKENRCGSDSGSPAGEEGKTTEEDRCIFGEVRDAASTRSSPACRREDASRHLRKAYRSWRKSLGVSSQLRVAHCANTSLSRVSLHNPPFLSSIVASLAPVTRRE